MPQDLWSSVDEALADLFVGRDSSLDAAQMTSDSAGLPTIAVSPNLGKLLSLLVAISGARRVLEIGTLGGYSTICLARSLPADGVLVSLELSEEHAAVARANIVRATLAAKIEIQVGDARKSLAKLAADSVDPFDFIFIDADKESYSNYLAGALELSRPGTVIVADNIVRGGAVFDSERGNSATEGIRSFLKDLSSHPCLSTAAIQLVGSKGHDGISITRVMN